MAWSACSDEPTSSSSGDTDVQDTEIAPEDTSDDDTDPLVDADVETVDDTEAPTFRDLRGELSGDVTVTLEFTESDAHRVLPSGRDLEVVVFARDDVSDAEALAISLEVNGEQLDVTPEYRNGLWRVATRISPGQSLYVLATDEAGNEARSPFGIVIPSLQAAAVGTWHQPYFDAEIQLTERVTYVVDAEGNWEATVGDESAAGSLIVEEDEAIQTNYVDGSTDVLGQHRGQLYLDETYLAVGAYTQDDATSHVGTWNQRVELTDGDGPTTVIATTLKLDDDGTWSQVVTQGDVDHETRGTYVTAINEDYADSLGQYLVRTTTEVDGELLETPSVNAELFDVLGDIMVLNPWVRAEE